MNHSLVTSELVKTIQEERLLQAERRRVQARQLITARGAGEDEMRMALGPGTQFAGVTDRILDTVTRGIRDSAASI